MRLTINKQQINLEDAPIANSIRNDMKDYDIKSDYNSIMRVYSGDIYSLGKMLQISAEICRNRSKWNAYGEDCKDLDIFVNATFYTEYPEKFFIVDFYMSDFWQYDGSNSAELIDKAYIRTFSED